MMPWLSRTAAILLALALTGCDQGHEPQPMRASQHDRATSRRAVATEAQAELGIEESVRSKALEARIAELESRVKALEDEKLTSAEAARLSALEQRVYATAPMRASSVAVPELSPSLATAPKPKPTLTPTPKPHPTTRASNPH